MVRRTAILAEVARKTKKYFDGTLNETRTFAENFTVEGTNANRGNETGSNTYKGMKRLNENRNKWRNAPNPRLG